MTYVSHTNGNGAKWVESSPKRQKIKHQSSPPSSNTSIDELLDSHKPEDVTFEPSRRSSQDISIRSLNSLGSGLKSERSGRAHPLVEHRQLEKMMNSAGPTRKNKPREESQIQQRNHGLPASADTSMPVHPIDLSGYDEQGAVQSKPNYLGEGTYHGTARQSFSSTNKDSPDTSKLQARTTEKISPYFSQPASPSLPERHIDNLTTRKQTPLDNQVVSSKLSGRLDQQFIPMSGQRRSLEHNLSSDADELQLGTTVGSNPDEKALSSIAHPRNQSPSKDSSSTLNATSPPNADTGLDPSHIRSSKFTAAEPKPQTDVYFSGPPIREKKAPWAVEVAAVSKSGEWVEGKGMGLVFDEPTKSCVLKIDGHSSHVRILPMKLQNITWEDSGRKMRFRSSQTGVQENIVDLELRRERDIQEVVKKLQPQSLCKVNSMSRCVHEFKSMCLDIPLN